MIPLSISLDLDQLPWNDLRDSEIEFGTLTRIGLLRHGTMNGRASVGLVVELPDGSMVGAQTTWALLKSAYLAMAASPIIAEEVEDF